MILLEVLYGHSAKHLGISNAALSVPQVLEEWLTERQLPTTFIEQQSRRADQGMKNEADKHLSDTYFEVGDLVSLKLQPNTQTYVATQLNQKLSYKCFFGPLKIIEKIGLAWLVSLIYPPTPRFIELFMYPIARSVFKRRSEELIRGRH